MPADTDLKKELDAFVARTLSIRKMSSPDISLAKNAKEYGTMLKRNFKNIGSIAAENRAMLESQIDPILSSDEPLSDDVVEALSWFQSFLLNPWPEEELDLTLLFLISKRLLKDATGKQDDDYIISQCGTHIYACYNNMDRVNRLRGDKNLTELYVQEGLRAADILLKYLDEDSFLRLNEESRRAVISHSRFYVALYDTYYYTDEEINNTRIKALLRSIGLASNPFYVENTPGMDWRKHNIRCMEHLGQLSENGNQWQLTSIQCQLLADYTERLRALWEEDPESGEELLPRVHLDLIILRNLYYSEQIDLERYRERLFYLYEKYANHDYDMYSVLANIFIPTEYMATVDRDHINEDSYDTLRWLYNSITEYILHSKNSESFSFLLEYLTSFLERFVDIPGEMNFEKMGLNCMAALHPPTYVHSLQVAALSRCLGERLLKKNPAAFIGVMGCRDTDDVMAKSDEILYTLYHGALCHDFGKICMIDTVFIYWRRISDEDFDIIRAHPANGAMQLSHYSSTRAYADIALGHHVWYDGSHGYPGSFDILSSDMRLLIGIVSISDSIDAATDSIGRSFKETHITVKKLMSEFKEGRGTRYCPEVVDLLDDPGIQADIDYILHQSREENYKNAYLILNRFDRNASGR